MTRCFGLVWVGVFCVCFSGFFFWFSLIWFRFLLCVCVCQHYLLSSGYHQLLLRWTENYMDHSASKYSLNKSLAGVWITSMKLPQMEFFFQSNVYSFMLLSPKPSKYEALHYIIAHPTLAAWFLYPQIFPF